MSAAHSRGTATWNSSMTWNFRRNWRLALIPTFGTTAAGKREVISAKRMNGAFPPFSGFRESLPLTNLSRKAAAWDACDVWYSGSGRGFSFSLFLSRYLRSLSGNGSLYFRGETRSETGDPSANSPGGRRDVRSPLTFPKHVCHDAGIERALASRKRLRLAAVREVGGVFHWERRERTKREGPPGSGKHLF